MRPEPRIRVSAMLRWRGAILLCRHEKRGREHWLLPGGGVRSGETLVEALQRPGHDLDDQIAYVLVGEGELPAERLVHDRAHANIAMAEPAEHYARRS